MSTPPEGKGLDQGAIGHVDDKLTAASKVPAPSQLPGARRGREPNANAPLVGPSTTVATRMYAGVGVSTRGRRGPLSKRVAVPLVQPPPAPAAPTATYDESTITVAWPADDAPEAGAPLPSYPLGASSPAFRTTRTRSRPRRDGVEPRRRSTSKETRLTKSPTSEHTYADTRIDWGKERCYAVRVDRIVWRPEDRER